MKKYEIGLIIGLVLTALIWQSPFIYSQQPINSNELEGKATQLHKKLAEEAAQFRKRIEENGDPIADFVSPESIDTNEQAVRKLRNRKYDFVPSNIYTIPITLDKSRYDLNITHFPSRVAEPAFPCRSDFVVIGIISDAKAFVSNDKASVYSEFKFQIDKILKNTTNFQTQVKSEIILNRGGGKVRLPSGRILHKVVDGLYMPKAGGEYLMFLEYDAESQTHGIITGYQLKDGKIESLDGISLDGDITGKYQNYPKYNGMTISEFEKVAVHSFVENKKCDTTKYSF